MSAFVKTLCLCAVHSQGWFSIDKTGLKQQKNVIAHS